MRIPGNSTSTVAISSPPPQLSVVRGRAVTGGCAFADRGRRATTLMTSTIAPLIYKCRTRTWRLSTSRHEWNCATGEYSYPDQLSHSAVDLGERVA